MFFCFQKCAELSSSLNLSMMCLVCILMWEDSESCETSPMMYVIYFPMRKSSGYVQPWTVTSLICCSSSSLNNPPSVFLGGKSCNQILIPEAQTRWWKLKSWRSLFFFSLSSVPPLPSPSRYVSCFYCSCSLFLSFPLLSLLSSCPPPPSIWLLVVYGVRKLGKLTWSPESRSI